MLCVRTYDKCITRFMTPRCPAPKTGHWRSWAANTRSGAVPETSSDGVVPRPAGRAQDRAFPLLRVLSVDPGHHVAFPPAQVFPDPVGRQPPLAPPAAHGALRNRQDRGHLSRRQHPVGAAERAFTRLFLHCPLGLHSCPPWRAAPAVRRGDRLPARRVNTGVRLGSSK